MLSGPGTQTEAGKTSDNYGMRQEVANMYVKHMEMRANSEAGETNIEQGLGLRLNQHREMRGCSKQMSCPGEEGDEQRERETDMGPQGAPFRLGLQADQPCWVAPQGHCACQDRSRQAVRD